MCVLAGVPRPRPRRTSAAALLRAAKMDRTSTLRESHASHASQHEPHKHGHSSHLPLSAHPDATIESGTRLPRSARFRPAECAVRGASWGYRSERLELALGSRPPSGPTTTVHSPSSGRLARDSRQLARPAGPGGIGDHDHSGPARRRDRRDRRPGRSRARRARRLLRRGLPGRDAHPLDAPARPGPRPNGRHTGGSAPE